MFDLAEAPILEAKGHWDFDVYEGDVETILDPLTGKIVSVKKLGTDLDAVLVDHFEGDNLIVTTGKQLLLDRLFATSGMPNAISAMGVGASATAAAVGDTQLGTTPTILAFDSTPTRSGLVITCVRTFATGEANINWQELGLFNGTVNGTSIMLNRIAPIGPFNKTSAVSIVVTVTITQA